MFHAIYSHHMLPSRMVIICHKYIRTLETNWTLVQNTAHTACRRLTCKYYPPNVSSMRLSGRQFRLNLYGVDFCWKHFGRVNCWFLYFMWWHHRPSVLISIWFWFRSQHRRVHIRNMLPYIPFSHSLQVVCFHFNIPYTISTHDDNVYSCYAM